MSIPKLNRIFDVKHNLLSSKKASLSLSINAIVVLVLAISMLGLGLAFTKSMFKKFGEKLTVPPPDLPATKDEPIVLPSEELEIRHGEEFTFQVNYFNDFSTGKVDAAISCGNPLTSTKSDSLIETISSKTNGCTTKSPCDVIVSPQKIEGGQQKAFKFIVPKSATSTGTIRTDICEVKFCAATGELSTEAGSYTSGTCNNGPDYESSKQITIKVT
ncbi:hypothetical protein J4206_05375 [Candidatus Woesearchaeota archaeon]|nr:hypothetical protein [Candidatus Woesearchaeota archaeon]